MDGEALKVLRKQLKLTQAQLGEALGYSRFAVNAWEKGHTRLPVDIVDRMAKANLAAPVQQAARAKHITRESHPQCFLSEPGRYTLAHPRWYTSGDCPLRNWTPLEEHSKPVYPADVDAHRAPAPEIVWQLLQNFVAANPAWESDAIAFMQRRGYTQFGTVVDHGPMSDAELMK